MRGPRPPLGTGARRLRVPVLVAAVSTARDADRALAAGADLIDASALSGQAAAALRGRPAARLWTGTPAAVDADRVAAGPGEPVAPVAAVAAAAAILTWLGTPAIRTRHVAAARRAIDMTRSIAGTRLPALTVRGLA